MKLHSIALAGCAAIALGAMGTPALAAHHHSAKSQEAIDNAREAKITDQLNEQQAQNPGSTPGAQEQIAANTDQNAAGNSSAVGRAAATAGNEIDKAVGPDKPVTNAELRKAVAVNDVAEPSKTLAAAEIKTQSGQALGQVKSVDVNPDGTVKAVKADVGGFLGMGEREVDIDATDLKYIKDRNILVTDMTKPQIENLPPVSKTY